MYAGVFVETVQGAIGWLEYEYVTEGIVPV